MVPAPDARAHLVAHTQYFGLGPVRHKLSDATQAAQATVPPVLIDADEFALYVSRIPALGPVLGRVISGIGVGFASYASYQAAGGIIEDFAQARAARTLVKEAKAQPGAYLTGDFAGCRAQTKLWADEARERVVSFLANVFMLPGSLLMDANLLASSLLLGGYFPGLVPWGEMAMAPAVVFMALYGTLIAVKAGIDCFDDHQSLKRLKEHRGEHSKAIDALRGRVNTLRLIDAALSVSGMAQAVGAIAMFLCGPVWLVPLLGGTLGLAFAKYKRSQVAGQWPVTPSVEAALEDGSRLECRPRQQMLARLAALDTERAELCSLTKGQRRAFKVARWLDTALPRASRSYDDHTQDFIHALISKLEREQLFGAVAQAVANDRLFRSMLPRPSARGHSVGAAELLRLVRIDAPSVVATDTKASEPQAQPTYDSERIERLCRIAMDTAVPLLKYRGLQEQALLDVTVLASLSLDPRSPSLGSAAQ